MRIGKAAGFAPSWINAHNSSVFGIGLVAVTTALAASAPPLATAGETVTVRLNPPTQATRIYLAPAGATIRSRLDRRLHFVGVLQRGHSALRFVVPPLDTGAYKTWCVRCAKSARLRVKTPTEPCLGTPGHGPAVDGLSSYGNGLLRTRVPADGTVVVDPERQIGADGSLGWTKLGWSVRQWSVEGELDVLLRRLDGPAPGRVIYPNRGDNGWSWAAPISFPSEGCWRVTGRVEDLALSFVVQVVVGN